MLPVARHNAAILAALIVTLFPVPARAQVNPNAGKSTGAAAEGPIDPNATPRPVLRAFATDEEIILDGRLDEEAWAAADSTTTPFYQIQPRPGYPSSERTVVRILYDSRNIYLGVELYDSEPDRLTIPGLEQDFATQNSDMFAVAIDSYWDKQSSFLFGFNPAGAVFDAQSFNDSRYLNPAWEGVVHVKTQIHDRGWTIEAAIPFTTLRFSATDGEQTWGLNFSRRIRRRNEDSNWAPLPRQFRLYKMSRAGTLT
ncbi:MAG: carbohydrate binding family 9 domain-containing protein, partial [Gemmatimonadetes bacterium]|nr:carbohydrate binding family 9 domain-containing protein [Gemmatimonadota bacterium]